MDSVAVIGAGPAGLASAIYLKRAGIEPVVFERDAVGGLLLNASRVENYPGFPEGISGEALAARMERHCRRWDIDLSFEEVKEVYPGSREWMVRCAQGDRAFPAVILATGTRAKRARFPGERDAAVYEVRHLGKAAPGDAVLIVGGGDAGFDYALTLAARGCSVVLTFRSPVPRCLGLLYERALQQPLIRLLPETIPARASVRDGGVAVECISKGAAVTIPSRHLLVAVGREPNLGVLSPELRERVLFPKPVPGLFLAGDVKRDRHRQAGIAVGDGIEAAMCAADGCKRQG